MLDWIAGLVVVVLLMSSLIWLIPWDRFTGESQKTRRVDPGAFRRTAVKVGLGALFSGFLLGFLAVALSFEVAVQARAPILVFLALVALPIGFAALLVSVFVLRVATLRALYKTDGQPQPSSTQDGVSR